MDGKCKRAQAKDGKEAVKVAFLPFFSREVPEGYKLAFSSSRKLLSFSRDWIIANFSSAFLFFFRYSLAPSIVNLRRRSRS